MNNFKVKSSELADRLAVLGKAIPSRTSNPILEGVLIEPCDGNKVSLTASNGNEMISTTLRIRGEVTDRVVLSYEWLKNICANCKGRSTITLEYNTSTKAVSASTIDAVINGNILSGIENFPNEEEVVSANVIRVDQETLVDTFDRVIFAALKPNSNDTREVLKGICIASGENGELNVAATNANVLSWNVMQSEWIEGEHTIIMPHTLVGIIKSMDNGILEMKVSGDLIRLYSHKYRVTARLIEGRYPNYQSVIPKQIDNYVMFSRYALEQAIKRANTFGNQDSGLVKIDVKGSKVTIIGSDEDTDVITEIPCIQSGNDILIGLDSSLCSMTISNLSGDTLKMYYSTFDRPAVFEGAEDTLKTLIMPMKVEEDMFASPLERALLAKADAKVADPKPNEETKEETDEEEEPTEEDCIGELEDDEDEDEDEEADEDWADEE